MSYRIFYHHGAELGLATKVEKGVLDIHNKTIAIKSGGNSYHIAFHDVEDVELIRLHKVGRVIRIKHSDGTHFLSRRSIYVRAVRANQFSRHWQGVQSHTKRREQQT